jgi:hypothetical protein
MATVQEAWAEYDWQTPERAWGLQFAVYRAILDAKGTTTHVKLRSDVRARQLAGAGTIDPYVSMDTYLITGNIARDELFHLL